jgi:pimeloyl-ACP methyl ester carboxylesterase
VGSDYHVDEQTIEVADSPVFFRRAAGTDRPSGSTALYLHSIPTSSDDWTELLSMTGGVAVDLPGFGRSGKGGQLDYSMNGYVDFLERFVDALELERVAVVGHGWGAAFGLQLALRRPELVSRLALVDAIPLLEGFSWPTPARWWRRPLVGELLMGSVNRWLLARTLRAGSASPAAWPDARVDAVWEQFDQGTQRAILRLHRSVQAADLVAAGRGLEQLQVPALVAWGEADPWLGADFADAYGARLPGATVHRVPGAGHWPWLDQSELAARLAGFLARAGGP